MLFLGRFDDHAAHVVAAIGADNVLWRSRAALGAVGELLGLFGVVRSASAGSRIGLTALGNGHGEESMLGLVGRPKSVAHSQFQPVFGISNRKGYGNGLSIG